MTHEDLVKFKKEVAGPRQKEILKKTKVQEGTVFLTKLGISLLNCRSQEVESFFVADGLIYKNGEVKEYHYEESDITVQDFVETHKKHKFMCDAKFELCDEMQELEISTVARMISSLEALCPDLKPIQKINIVDSWEWVKMKFMYDNDIKEDDIAQM